MFDEGFDVGVRDVGEGYVEDVVGCWVEGVEEAVEEDCVDDGCTIVRLVRYFVMQGGWMSVITFDNVLDGRSICDDLQVVFWCSFGLHDGCRCCCSGCSAAAKEVLYHLVKLRRSQVEAPSCRRYGSEGHDRAKAIVVS